MFRRQILVSLLQEPFPTHRQLRILEYLLVYELLRRDPSDAAFVTRYQSVLNLLNSLPPANKSPKIADDVQRYRRILEQALRMKTLRNGGYLRILLAIRETKYTLGPAYLNPIVIKAAIDSLLTVDRIVQTLVAREQAASTRGYVRLPLEPPFDPLRPCFDGLLEEEVQPNPASGSVTVGTANGFHSSTEASRTEKAQKVSRTCLPLTHIGSRRDTSEVPKARIDIGRSRGANPNVRIFLWSMATAANLFLFFYGAMYHQEKEETPLTSPPYRYYDTKALDAQWMISDFVEYQQTALITMTETFSELQPQKQQRLSSIISGRLFDNGPVDAVVFFYDDGLTFSTHYRMFAK